MTRASDLRPLRLSTLLCCAFLAGVPLAHAQEAQKQQVQKLLGAVSQGAAVAEQIGIAGQALAGAAAA